MSKIEKIFTGLLFIFCLSQSAAAAAYVVTKIADTNDGTCDADCSLREAVNAAGASADNDVITFSALFDAPQTIVLGGTDLIIAGGSGTLTINGAGANKLTVSGNNASRVFTNNTGAVTTINNLRVTGGTGVSTVSTGRGGGIYNSGGTLTVNGLIVSGNTTANGGGLNNAGTATLTVNNSAIFDNTATGSGGGLQNFSGNTTNIYNSAIYNNTCNSTGTGGGAMQANGSVTIVNSTFSGNNAVGGSGGAIYYNGTVLNVTNTTIAGNTSTNNGGGIHKTSNNPGNFRNSIIALNNGVAGSPDATGAYTSLGTNIIGNVGISTGWIASDLQNVNPMLGAFGDNGGLTGTFLPMPGSPAINAGQNCVLDLSCASVNPPFPVTTDQRGAARPANGIVDIGSVEVSATISVTISGRVAAANGAPIPNTIVTLSDAAGIIRTAKTNSFGNFVLTGVQSGQSYSLNAASRRYNFTAQTINPSGDVSGIILTPIAASFNDLKK